MLEFSDLEVVFLIFALAGLEARITNDRHMLPPPLLGEIQSKLTAEARERHMNEGRVKELFVEAFGTAEYFN